MDYKEKQRMYEGLYKSSGKTIWVSKAGKNAKGQTYTIPEKLKLKLLEKANRKLVNK